MSLPYRKHEKVYLITKGKPPLTCYVAAVAEDGSLFLKAREYGMFWVTPCTDCTEEEPPASPDVSAPDISRK